MKVINLSLPSDGSWVDINTASGIAVGTNVTVQCDGTAWVRIQESDTKPDTPDQGKLITNLSQNSAEAIVNNSPLKLWARSTRPNCSASIAIQEL